MYAEEENSRFFIIYIEKYGIESDPIYCNNTENKLKNCVFEYCFTEVGNFAITCANYPKIKGYVTVYSKYEANQFCHSIS